MKKELQANKNLAYHLSITPEIVSNHFFQDLIVDYYHGSKIIYYLWEASPIIDSEPNFFKEHEFSISSMKDKDINEDFLKKEYLKKQTKWWFALDDGKILGSYKNLAIVWDSEDDITPLCLEIQNVPYYYLSQIYENMDSWQKVLSKNNIDLNSLLEKYQKLCQKHHLKLNPDCTGSKFYNQVQKIDLEIRQKIKNLKQVIF